MRGDEKTLLNQGFLYRHPIRYTLPHFASVKGQGRTHDYCFSYFEAAVPAAEFLSPHLFSFSPHLMKGYMRDQMKGHLKGHMRGQFGGEMG